MPIRITCRCEKRYDAPDILAGRTVKCPNCGAALAVPEANEPNGLFSELEELASLDAVGGVSTVSAGLGSPHRHHARRRLWVAPAVVAGLMGVLLLTLLIFLVSRPDGRRPGDGGNRGPVASSRPHGHARPSSGDSMPTTPEGGQDHRPAASAPAASVVAGSRPGSSSVAPLEGEPLAGERQRGPTAHFRGEVVSRADQEALRDRPASGYLERQLPAGLLQWYHSGELVATRTAGDAALRELHYGWMLGLLPHLGYQDHYDRFDFSKPWYDEANLQLTAQQIPELLNPAEPHTRYQGYPYSGMAVTHFVGVSGVERARNDVAALLPRTDSRAGIFGYDEIATADQMRGGAAQTLMLVGSGELACPWVQSGGSTIRGARAPYFGSLTGFGSAGGPGRGAIGVMADGSVRWIDAGIDPEVFRDMCTIAD